MLDYNAGTKGNISSWTRQVDGTRETSHQDVTGQAGNRVQTVGTTQSGLILDSDYQISDITDTTLLTVLSQQLQLWRRSPRVLLDLKLSATADLLPVRDFDIGDEIYVQMVGARFSLDGLVRVYGWTLTRSAAGEARCESVIISPNDQGDV